MNMRYANCVRQNSERRPEQACALTCIMLRTLTRDVCTTPHSRNAGAHPWLDYPQLCRMVGQLRAGRTCSVGALARCSRPIVG